MYIILYKDTTGVSMMPRYYTDNSYNINVVLENFYERHVKPSVNFELFSDIIRKIEIDRAVALHNGICPDFYITDIYEIGKDIYSETVEKETCITEK